MDIVKLVTAVTKLADYAASGIGSVAGPMLASWKARREANAKLIVARGEVEAQRILAEGQAQTMQIIAHAQADARATLVSPDATVQGQLEFGAAVNQRIQFQEEKRQSNIVAVIGQAAQELGDREVQDHEVDHDWTARFFNDVQDVSSEEMQQLWAKILAGEVEKPGSTSIKTLDILKNLDKSNAILFRNLSSICVSIRPDGNKFIDARVPSLGSNAGTNSLREYGLDFGNLNVLNEHGLIISDYNSWYDMRVSIGLTLPQAGLLYIPFHFQGKYWILIPTNQRDLNSEFRLSGVALTKSGQELSRIVDLESANRYSQDLKKYFDDNSLNMVQVDSWMPRTYSPGTS